MKVYLNLNTEYSPKNNVNKQKQNIHNRFNTQNYNFEKHNKHSIKFEGISKNIDDFIEIGADAHRTFQKAFGYKNFINLADFMAIG